MGIGQLGLLLMVFSDLVHLLASPSPSPPLHKTLVSGYVQEQEQVGAELINAKPSTIERGARVVSVNRRGGGGGGGGHGGGVSASRGGGRSSGTGDNGGSSGSPYTGAAASGVVPIFVAGTITHHGGNNQNHHHGAGSSIGSYVGLTALGAAILASLI